MDKNLVDLNSQMSTNDPADTSLFYQLLTDSPQAMAVYGTDGLAKFLNPGFIRLLGGAVEEFEGKSLEVLIGQIHPDDRPFFLASLEESRLRPEGSSLPVLLRLLSRQKEYRLIEATIVNRQLDLDHPGQFLYLNPVVDRKLAEDMLLSERERLQVTIQSIGEGVIATDVEGTVTLMNAVAYRLTGWAPGTAVGRRLKDVLTIQDDAGNPLPDPLERVLGAGQPVELTSPMVLVSLKGESYFIEDSATPIRNKKSEIIGAVLVFRDVTRSRRDAQEILKVQKLESIGILAGGIAHDFNNIMTAIMGNISLAQLETVPGSEMDVYLQDLQKASERATQLTHQLLTFSKGGSPVLSPTSLEAVIRDSAQFIIHGSRVELEIIIPKPLPTIEVDKGQLSQVIQNLVLNARQAMPEGGLIRIEAREVQIGEGENPNLQAGAYIRTAVEDLGPGIPQDQLFRIFDPYFTTKAQGNGLGLSIVYSIIRNHGGWITAESPPGKGASFIFYLPAKKSYLLPFQSGFSVTPGKIQGKCLIMDDEDMPRKVIRQMVSYLGLECTEASSPAQALELFESSRNQGVEYDLIILDLTVPGTEGGRETLTKLRSLGAKSRIIVSSGYSSDPVMSRYQEYGFDGSLAKPFSLKDLNEVVQRLLVSSS